MTDKHLSPTRAKRKGLSAKVRFDVFKRDGFVCQYCGAHPPAVILHCDHVKPVAEGGTNATENLVTACQDCNQGKAAVPLSIIPESMADRAARVAESEAQIRGYAEVMADQRYRVETDAWWVIKALFGVEELRRDWFVSVKRFVSLIGTENCMDAAEVAAHRGLWNDNDTFKYFCGICWTMSKE
ncbi:HNHc domain containing protein [uncultured Caudovirales phage]|uniref:HNHc domain containing protein n=1 Tax=uncultured Caudovirales phage TaxID=2100421 RepID=A0A6J5NED0_9CAUD|nr:HNHc domain containing protein [uncultured Caudovirales phage]